MSEIGIDLHLPVRLEKSHQASNTDAVVCETCPMWIGIKWLADMDA